MRDTVEELAERGKTLAPNDRSRLVDMLLASLEESSLAEIESSWDIEAERRLSMFDKGEIQAVDGEQVLNKARAIASK
jgi:hypothetical protein